ncbi:MAG TPA: hypothetical protein VGZ22_02515 [Isosphaeraceae bacterium]|jgi:hypothetical protein|nr:hypothetical protein [Isosphaeraceae bacterium]
MAGYSGKPLAQKLGIKEHARISLRGEPAGIREELGVLPDGAQFVGGGEGAVDVAMVFARDAKTLRHEFTRAAAAIAMNGMLWVAWPKRASKVPTDLTENLVREIGLNQGLVDVKVCAIDETWSGLKFVRRLKDRT